MAGEAHADGRCDRVSAELSQSPRIHPHPQSPRGDASEPGRHRGRGCSDRPAPDFGVLVFVL